MGEFSRRRLLSTAMVAGAAMTASAAEAAEQVPEPSRAGRPASAEPIRSPAMWRARLRTRTGTVRLTI